MHTLRYLGVLATFAAVYFVTEIPLLLGVVTAYRWRDRLSARSALGRVLP